MSDPVQQYLTGQLRPDQPALLAAFGAEGAQAVATMRPALDLPYGPHPRQRFDLFRAPGGRGTFAYLHAGYWQSRDKSQFRFLAPAIVAAGLHFVAVNYPLCPDVTLAALTEAVRCVVPAVVAQADAPLIVVGHSAGAHLAVELALADQAACGTAARGKPSGVVAGVVALSGVFDLRPLLETPLNDKLRLDPVAAAAASPLFRLRDGLPRAVFTVGGLETEAFQAQTAAMHHAWLATGAASTALVVEGADHFSLLRALCDPGTALSQAVRALL